MKYKLLLVGKNKGLINDFFMQMDTFFDCLTSSMRFSDLLGHLKYFNPHAVVFCMNAENRDDIIAVINLHNQLERTKIPLVLICDSDDYNLFSRLSSTKEELLLVKPISLITIQEKLLSYLNKYAPEDKQAYESIESSSTDSENTFYLISQLEKALDLPYSESVSESQSDAEDVLSDSQASDGPKRIMIIDDSPGMLKAIKEQLGSDYEVATAISGKIALKYLQNKTVDLILLDYAMPEEDGPAVFEKLLATPKTADIPVIFLTGINDSAMIQKALSLKPKGYMLKPVDKETLLTKVHEILG